MFVTALGRASSAGTQGRDLVQGAGRPGPVNMQRPFSLFGSLAESQGSLGPLALRGRRRRSGIVFLGLCP